MCHNSINDYIFTFGSDTFVTDKQRNKRLDHADLQLVIGFWCYKLLAYGCNQFFFPAHEYIRNRLFQLCNQRVNLFYQLYPAKSIL